jgi:hypothetical protein
MAQLNYLGAEVGGERFEYDPDSGESPRGAGKERNQPTAASPPETVSLTVYPVPASDLLNVQIGAGIEVADAMLLVFDSYGRLLIQRSAALRREGTAFPLEVTGVPPGLYYLELRGSEGRRMGGTLFSKI